MTPNIAFIGRTGAGKTTCADLLIQRFMYERISFAEPLKVGCATRDDRTLLQKVGQGVRELYPDFWVNLAVADMRGRERQFNRHPTPSNYRNYPKWVNDDTRYENEAQKLKEEGFVIVRVVADEQARIDRGRRSGRLQSLDQLHHISETALDAFPADYTIHNEEGTPTEDLVADLETILNRERK